MNDWRQGDFTLTPIELPLLTTEDGEPTIVLTTATPVVVISQSCDIIRSAVLKPYVQVAVLSPATPEEMADVKAGARVRYSYLPALEPHGLVVDLDVTATVDKETAQHWEREAGCTDDNQRRAFAASLARHRQRFAFPDEFNEVVKPLRKWVESKRSSDSHNGRLIRAIREIRVLCDNWDEPSSLIFWLMLETEIPGSDEAEWMKAADGIRTKVAQKTKAKIQIVILKYDDLSASEYLSSDRLDLDGLSDA